MSFLLALLLCAAPARAGDAPAVQGGAVSTKDTELARRMKEALQNDPEAARILAERVLRSSLADQFIDEEGPKGKSPEERREAAVEDVRKWILDNPGDAAFLAVGFAKDDREGNHKFEESLSQRVDRFFALNPDRDKGILGRLNRLGSESQILSKQMDMDDDERRQLLQRMFEGSSQTQARVSGKSGAEGGKGAEAPSKGASYAGDALYDRLSAGNPTGYSPQVQQLQSELNASRAPGAPRLIETGKLDYPTLRHPYYALAYDADRLEGSYRAQRAFAQARALGLEGAYPPERYHDPAVQKELEEKAKGKTLVSFERRRAAVAAARRAVEVFDAEAEKTKDPKAITAKTLRGLSQKRRDAARRIAAAALEGEASRLELFKGFLTPPLVEAVRRAAPDAESAELYLRRGAELEAKLDRAVGTARSAIALLEKDSEPETLAQADPLMREAQRLAKTLGADIAFYMDAPGRLAGARPSQGLQARLEALAARWLPGTSFGQRALEKRRARQEALDAFLRVARVGFP